LRRHALESQINKEVFYATNYTPNAVVGFLFSHEAQQKNVRYIAIGDQPNKRKASL
jgi:hypothetical protein